MKHFLSYFDKLEDIIRARLSHYPIVYAFIGAIGIILVWKGVWETAELFPSLFGPPSFILGAAILLLTGLLVSFFIGDSIIISGFRKEKKLAEKVSAELRVEKDILEEVSSRLDVIEKELEHREGESKRDAS